MRIENKYKIFCAAIIFCAIILIFEVKASAISIYVTTSKSTVSAGEKFTATITGSDATGKVNISVTNGNASSSEVWVENNSQSITITAGSSGTVSISASGELSSADGKNDKEVSSSKTVSISNSSGENSGGSTNNGGTSTNGPTLSNLGINPHDFSGFSASKTSYSVTVPNDCTSVNLYATSNNGTVSGTGTKTLKEGTNKFSVTVSNSSGSKTYTVSVVRLTADGEEVPNVTEDDGTEETNDGIGLATLEIPGYELNEEFQTGVYEYTIEVDKKLTLQDLEKIKETIVATANTENVNIVITPTVADDGTATITIIVSDDEKEYAKYVITFEVPETEEKVAGIVTSKSNNSSGITGMFGLTEEQQIYALLGISLFVAFIAIVSAISNYAKSRRIAEYEEEDELEDESEFSKMNQYYSGISTANNIPEVKEDSERAEDLEKISEPSSTVDDIETSVKKMKGYRKIARGRRSYGKH